MLEHIIVDIKASYRTCLRQIKYQEDYAMFGLGKLIDDFCDDPIGTTARTAVKSVTQPVVDSLDILNGLTEGELRHRAALRLGADVVAGMALSEVVDYLS